MPKWQIVSLKTCDPKPPSKGDENIQERRRRKMRLPKLEYFQPTHLNEAFDLLERYKGEAKLIAGGTDILLLMKNRKLTPKYLVSLNKIPGLDTVQSDKGLLKIGARCKIHAIETHPVIRKQWGMLAQAAGLLGSVQVRNLATIGGNLCNAAPSADTASPLIALDAKAVIVSKKGERVLLMEEFFKGPGATDLKEGEILKEIQVPKMSPKSGGYYLKFSRRKAMDLAHVGVACVITMDGKDSCRDARIVLGAVAPTPLRVRRAEEALKSKVMDGESMEKASQIAMEESRPISDVRSSEWYRKKMVKVMTGRALKQAISLAKSA
jgi:CO/xanthine dehydrogenase FAD-binding subunit